MYLWTAHPMYPHVFPTPPHPVFNVASHYTHERFSRFWHAKSEKFALARIEIHDEVLSLGTPGAQKISAAILGYRRGTRLFHGAIWILIWQIRGSLVFRRGAVIAVPHTADVWAWMFWKDTHTQRLRCMMNMNVHDCILIWYMICIYFTYVCIILVCLVYCASFM